MLQANQGIKLIFIVQRSFLWQAIHLSFLRVIYCLLHFSPPLLHFILSILLLIILWFYPSRAYADNPTFDTSRTFGLAIYNTRSVAVGDLNGDGFLDIAVGNYFDETGRYGQDYVYFNDGKGNFLTSVQLNTSSDQTWSVALGDVDGDGDLDIAVGNYNQQNLIYLNDGMGHFPTTINFGTDSDATLQVALGDLNSDGFLDIAVANYGQDVVYLNDGTGHFSTAVNFGNGVDNTYSLALGDIDGNGFLDIATGNHSGPEVVYLNDGTGHFPTSINLGPGDDITWGVAVADMNGDRTLDVIVNNQSQQNVIYLNDGTGNFSNTINFGTGSDNSRSVPAIGDLNSDGNLDLIIANSGEQDVIYLNDGAGNLNSTINFGTGSDYTRSLALGDMNGDGALDIVAGYLFQQNQVYFNSGQGNFATAINIDNDITPTRQVAVADLNGDKALDVVLGNYDYDFNCSCYVNTQNFIYFNDGVGNFPPSLSVPLGSPDITMDVAVGDLNRDDALDIIIVNREQQDIIYLNDGNGNFSSGITFGSNLDQTKRVEVGDLDSDGALDIIIGNRNKKHAIYLNDGSGNFGIPIYFGSGLDTISSIAIGDLDGDSDLDVVIGNLEQQNVVYLNNGVADFTEAGKFGSGFERTIDMAIGDFNGDSSLDIVIGNNRGQSAVYVNNGSGNFSTPINFGSGSEVTTTVAIGDLNGDGTLDIVVGNMGTVEPQGGQSVVYLNDGVGNFTSAINFGSGSDNTLSLAVGDLNNDGALDIVAGNRIQQDAIYLNGIHQAKGLTNHGPALNIARPIPTWNANFYSTPIFLDNQYISLTYTLFDSESDSIGRIAAFYSQDGGDNWKPAVATTNTITTNLVTRPFPTSTLVNTHIYTWDAFASGFFGQSDNVVLRLVAYPQPVTAAITGTYRYTNTIPGPYQWHYASATTFPFRVRGTQVQVISGTTGISQALVYRLPVGQAKNGFLMGNTITTPFRTNGQGYLQGRGQIRLGDHLLALAPVPLPPPYSERYSGTVRLYYTNGAAAPDITGLNTFTVTQPGVQQVAVSPDRPLLLFDLDISLEWDASNNTAYLERLANELQVASEALYDFTNGQAALGRITVYQNREAWDTADIQIRATNRLRPFASQGGLVLTDTIDPAHQTPPDWIVYQPGQVTMGATWNRYGSVGQEIGQDWPLALAHELSHYLFFLDDIYMGLNDDDLLLPITDCIGSAMGDVYLQANTEFIYDEAFWQANCADTLAARALGRTEWQTLRLWYPWTVQPTTLNAGPTLMPFDFTSVEIRPPAISNNLLDDPTFELLYSGGSAAPASSNGQAFLIRGDRIIDLGSPRGDLKTVLARGAQVGDTLCAFDPPQRQYGCETIVVGDTLLQLEQDNTWTPLIQLSPVNSTTFALRVESLPAGLSLNARLYPESGSPSGEISLTEVNGIYQAQFPVLSQPALAGHVRVWVSNDDPATETNPRREAIAPFSIGGNPPKSRGGHAPVVSPDGQMIFFTRDEANFGPGQFYLVQSMAGLPPLPPGKKAIGPGYNLLAAPGTPVLTGSVSFQYLEVDVDTERADETQLAIHFWNGTQWRALETVGNINYNLASARSQGPGIYALLAGVTTPIITAYDPPVATNDLTTTLTITGSSFLAPLQVELRGSTVYTLAGQVVNSAILTATLPPGLPAQEYQPVVLNGDGGSALTPGTLSLFNQDLACFYDNFESGANKWQRSDEWGIVTFGDGNGRAMTDTPAHPYLDAPPPAITHTAAITSLAFSLANCQEPVLTFSHAYDIYNFSAPGVASRDVGRVEISTYAEQSGTWSEWQELQHFFNGVNSTGLEQAAVTSPEWYKSTDLQHVQINLSSYTGTVRLRFSLEADNTVPGKGWIIDELGVKAGSEAPPSGNSIFLPIVLKSK